MPLVGKVRKNYSGKELYQAAEFGDINTVKRLLKSGINPDQYRHEEWSNSTALIVAASKGHVDVVKALISAGADVNIKNAAGYTAQPWASLGGHTEALEILLEASRHKNVKQRPPYRARISKSGNKNVVHQALSGAANVCLSPIIGSAQNLIVPSTYDPTLLPIDVGDTAQTWASHEGHTEVEDILPETSSDRNVKDYYGGTAPQGRNSKNAVHQLLSGGAELFDLSLQIGSAQNLQVPGAPEPTLFPHEPTLLPPEPTLLPPEPTLLPPEPSNTLPEGAAAQPQVDEGEFISSLGARDEGNSDVDVDEMSFWMEALGVRSSGANGNNDCSDPHYNPQAYDPVREEDLCKICMDAVIDCVLLRCGHIVSCIQCGKQLSRCPVCRGRVSEVVRTYKA